MKLGNVIHRLKIASREIGYFIANVMEWLSSLTDYSTSIPKAKGEVCILLGNGPSLRENLEKDLPILQSHQCIAVNKFSLSKSFEEIKPCYYTLLDPLFFKTDAQLLGVEPQVIQDIQATYDALCSKVFWEMTLFLPAHAHQGRDLKKEVADVNPNIRLVYYKTNNYEGKSALWFLRKHQGIAGGMNVLHAAMSLALQMNYRKIAIIGADHTWAEQMRFDKERKELYLDDSHVSRVVRRYFSDMKTTMAREAWSLYRCFEPYQLLGHWATHVGATINNCSSYSYIDEFPFTSLKEFCERDNIQKIKVLK